VTDAAQIPSIYVIAGTNGAGKSSLAGAMLLQQGGNYFNPDEAASQILSANPGITRLQANSEAWYEGKRLLERAVAERLYFAFETTLGGKTITGIIHEALSRGLEVRMLYVGLSSPDLHIARVRSRVTRGGHDIPVAKILERYNRSLVNLIKLVPMLTELKVYDNSKEADPNTGAAPQPVLILHSERGKIVSRCELSDVPQWAKPIVAAAM